MHFLHVTWIVWKFNTFIRNICHFHNLVNVWQICPIRFDSFPIIWKSDKICTNVNRQIGNISKYFSSHGRCRFLTSFSHEMRCISSMNYNLKKSDKIPITNGRRKGVITRRVWRLGWWTNWGLRPIGRGGRGGRATRLGADAPSTPTGSASAGSARKPSNSQPTSSRLKFKQQFTTKFIIHAFSAINKIAQILVCACCLVCACLSTFWEGVQDQLFLAIFS